MDSFCRYVIQQDINKIALDLREAHKDDFSASRRTTHWKIFCRQPRKQSERAATQSRRPMMFICKRLKLNYKKLSEEEKKWLKRMHKSLTC